MCKNCTPDRRSNTSYNIYKLDVSVSPTEERMWLSTNKMAGLVERDEELSPFSTCAENAQVQVEGNRII